MDPILSWSCIISNIRMCLTRRTRTMCIMCSRCNSTTRARTFVSQARRSTRTIQLEPESVLVRVPVPAPFPVPSLVLVLVPVWMPVKMRPRRSPIRLAREPKCRGPVMNVVARKSVVSVLLACQLRLLCPAPDQLHP